MSQKPTMARAALSVLGAALLLFGGGVGIANADVAGPTLPSIDAGSWAVWLVVAFCAVVIIGVAIGIFSIRRARAKRRASEPGSGS